MGFLRRAARFAGHDQVDGSKAFCFAAVATEQRDAFESELLGCLQGCNDVGGIPAGRDADHEVAGLGEAFDLAGEGKIEAVVVGYAGDEGTVCIQRNGRKRTAVFEVAADQFGREMLSFRCASSVATDQEFFPGAQRILNQRAGAIDIRADFLE